MKIPGNFDKNVQKPHVNFVLLSSIIFLFGLGLVTLYSGSYNYAESVQKNGFHFVGKQLGFGALGVVVFFVAIIFKLDWLRHKQFVLLILLATLIFNIVPIIWGNKINGAHRWFPGFFSFQPSEIVKIVLPFYLAHMLDRQKERLDNFMIVVLPLVIVSFLFLAVIAGQNSFAIALFLSMNIGLVFLMAGIKIRYILGILVFVAILGAVLVMIKPHRIARFYYYFHPDEGRLTINHQVDQSINAVMSGGFWGRGVGQGTETGVSEVQSDFIFSSFAEEFGFLGVVIFMCLSCVFMVQGYASAFKAEDMFRRLLAFSYVTIIVSQIAVNLGVIIRVLPTTGIPLPFFSAGGSSLVSTFAICGVIVNISRSSEPMEIRYHKMWSGGRE
jgi:cell division protein FtsW